MFAGGFVERFLGEIQLLGSAELLEAQAGHVDALGDGMAAIDFDREKGWWGDGERLGLGERIVGKIVIVDLGKVDAEVIFDGQLDRGRGGAAPVVVGPGGGDGGFDGDGKEF